MGWFGHPNGNNNNNNIKFKKKKIGVAGHPLWDGSATPAAVLLKKKKNDVAPKNPGSSGVHM
jgi:hypothetical protein